MCPIWISGNLCTVVPWILALVVAALVYLDFFRPWQLHWGATAEEVARPMLGDEIVGRPSFNATRAVTVRARPEHIYPWIVQMGVGRAGWYSYDILDNLGRRSAETIVPEWQGVQPGDLIPMSPDGKQGVWVKEFEPDQRMLWWDQRGETTWLWEIVAVDESTSRLITRVRMRYRWNSPAAVFNLLIELADWPMMRKCMLGIKRRAEALAVERQDARG
jgi:hypothetical protein